jgi:hypothetical protein
MTENEQEEALGTIDTLTIFTLLVRCPTGGAPSASYPFAWLRGEYTLEERFHLAESLPQTKRREMLVAHRRCLARVHMQVNTIHHFD